MSDQQDERPGQHQEQNDEVEGHAGKRVAANQEHGDDTQGDDEVEAHSHIRKS